jgi:hypothetical protein
MSETSPEQNILQSPLAAILRSEIDLGNEIDVVQRGGWSKVDIVVTFKFAFRKNYQNEFEGTEFYRNTDSHYPLTDSYTCPANREAIEAPY